MLISRKHQRFNVNIPAEVDAGQVTIKNLSIGGAFIHGLAGELNDNNVRIIVKGLFLEGKVRWVRGSGEYGFGVEFGAELSKDGLENLMKADIK